MTKLKLPTAIVIDLWRVGALLWFLALIFGANAYAIDCPPNSVHPDNGSNQALEISSCIGYPCGVCATRESDYFAPEIAVVLDNGIERYTANLSVSECTYFGGDLGKRVCARIVFPRVRNDENGNCILEGPQYGNNTGCSPAQRPMLCAHYDPLDGNDTDIDFNPFYHRMPAEDALSVAEAARAGAATGGFVGLAAGFFAAGLYAAVGSAIGALSAAILEVHNHVVYNDMGCVDIPLAQGPPPFSNDAWHTDFLPSPELVADPNSTFTAPSVRVNICVDGFVIEEFSDSRPSVCLRDADGNLLREERRFTEISHSFVLRVTAPNYDSLLEGSCEETPDGRTICARVTERNPDELCVFLDEGNGEELQYGCVDRPEFTPLPEVSDDGSTFESASITVSLEGQSITLAEDPGIYNPDIPRSSSWGYNCGTLHKARFCAYRTCLDGPPNSFYSPGSCNIYDSRICVLGYEAAPVVAADNATANVLPAGPNTNFPAGEDVPTQSENAVGETVMQQFESDVMAYDPPFCWERNPDTGACTSYDEDGDMSTRPRCLRYDEDDPNRCVDYENDNLPGDPYFVDYQNQHLRTLQAHELGLCVDIPASRLPWVRDVPGEYDYQVPINCEYVKVQLWGAGGGGRTGSDTGDDSAGDAGGYVEAVVRVVENEIYRVTVGTGGGAASRGGASIVATSPNAIAGQPYIGSVFAEGGRSSRSRSSSGGNGSCGLVAEHEDRLVGQCNIVVGLAGNTVNCDATPGAAPYGGDPLTHAGGPAQPAGECISRGDIRAPAPGGGGCASDRCRSRFPEGGFVGFGGHGKAILSCVDGPGEN